MHFEKWFNKNINISLQKLKNGSITSWVNLKNKYELTNDMFFKWAQSKHEVLARQKKTNF